jgi:hypothetical protein
MANTITGKCAAMLETHGGLRAILRKYGIVRLIDGAMREAWESLGMRILHRWGRGPEKTYGWLEGFFSPTCDYWVRYTQVIAALKGLPQGSVRSLVEVSSGGRGGIAWALPGTQLKLCMVDWSTQLLRDPRGGKAWRVCADACRLPFADCSFDAAVSLDTIEHLSRGLRAPFLDELKRVAAKEVVLTCPLQSEDGTFQAGEFDLGLHRKIQERNGVQPEWLREHIEHGHPTKEELSRLLPGAQITGSENCQTWLRFASLYQRAFLWPLAGLFYFAVLRKRDTQPPYRRGLLVWHKQPEIAEPDPAEADRTILREAGALH